jgi:Na+-transporting methylmalonyl-CoA/oxaloacetate decarboxylase gamma subunit
MHILFGKIGILAQLTGQTSTGSNTLILVGFMFVLTALALLAAVIAAIGAVFARRAAEEAKKAAIAALEHKVSDQDRVQSRQTDSPAEASEAVSQPEQSIEDDPALIAVISAAIHSIIGEKPHRVVSIRRTDAGWAEEGRRQIFSSHRPR